MAWARRAGRCSDAFDDCPDVLKECPACGACFAGRRRGLRTRRSIKLRLSLPVARTIDQKLTAWILAGRKGRMGAVHEARWICA